MAIWTKYLILHHTVLILMMLPCIFLWSKYPFVKVPRKSDPSVFVKNGRLSQNWRRRGTLCNACMPIELAFFNAIRPII